MDARQRAELTTRPAPTGLGKPLGSLDRDLCCTVDAMRHELPPPEGCVPIDHLITPDGQRTFVRSGAGAARPDGLDVSYFRRESDGALIGRVGFGPACQGPPGHAHGGSMAAVLDDAMGVAAWIAGHPVVAAEIRIRFKNMLPLGALVGLEARVTRVDGKRVTTEGRLVPWSTFEQSVSEGTPTSPRSSDAFALGEGIFVRIGSGRFAELAREAEAREAARAREEQ